MMTLKMTLPIARRAVVLPALSALLGAGLAVANAQQTVAPAEPRLNFQAPVSVPEPSFSSSSAENQLAVAENPFDFMKVAGTQPPPRRSYGRPRYRGGNTNADGSNKYAFLIGGGLGLPVADTHTYLTPSWGLQVGGGRNFNKTFGVMAQFDYDNFGFQAQTITNQSTIYFGGQGFGLDGNSHVWSLTLDPVVNLTSGEGMGAYIVGGVGFYHKTANFTVPATGVYCDPYYGICYQYAANETIDKYTSNAPGFNGGMGFTYKVSRFSGERLYGEVRYVYMVNSPRTGFTVANVNSAPLTATNFYPANSNRTSYIPVKFGIRF